ncbi:MAG: hypothetical protein EOO53_17465 [Gammaproteobacteria bacterium]|nr:MAG: hypothetical protein EOO53_17465 [Gammaproteobacteria bacterium]
MVITEAIVHSIEKEAGTTRVIQYPKETLSPIDDHMNRLGNELLSIYSKNTNNYGSFGIDPLLHQFPNQLARYYSLETNLIEFSKIASSLIANKMEGSPPSTGGYVLFIRYENQGKEWLLIVMLKLKTGTGIDKKTLELNESVSFDIQHLHEAARIDLQKWQSSEQPYLSFVKKSGRQDDVTKYFRTALSCTDYIDSKFHTEQLLKAVDAYCLSSGWSADQKQTARRRMFEYCDEKFKSGEPVNLKAVSAIINDQLPEDFNSFVRNNHYPINETFDPHKKTFSRLKRIHSKFSGIAVSFEAADVINETVDFDKASRTLYIKNIPETLILEIERAKGNDAAAE